MKEYRPKHAKKEGEVSPEKFFVTAGNVVTVFLATVTTCTLLAFAIVFMTMLPNLAVTIQQNPACMVGDIVTEVLETAILAAVASLALSVPVSFVITVFTTEPVEAVKKAVKVSEIVNPTK